MENLSTAFMLMAVGMVTVFTILLVVILLGKVLTTLVNKYAPAEVQAPAKHSHSPAPIPGNILAAITAAVNVVTQGKGKITKIEKK